MKRILGFLFVLSALLTACTDDDHMRRQLQVLQARNQADSLLTDLPLATSLCDYFDSHGTPNERMLAHYLLGRTHADRGEAPEALEAYHSAAECADTTASDCDYRLLGRIHGQAAELLYAQMLPSEALDELDLTCRYAERAKDTLTWLAAYESKNDAYCLLGEKDSAMSVLKHVYELYHQYGYHSKAANCAGAMFFYMTENSMIDEAGRYMDIYETQSENFQGGAVREGMEIYYYFKGLYYLNCQRLDSAEYYFRKELSLTNDTNQKEATYKGLYHLFKQAGNVDSVAKYADLCYQTSDEAFRTSNMDELRKMHALYNFQHFQTMAYKKTAEAAKSRQNLTVVIAISLFIILLLTAAFLRIRRKKKEAVRQLEADYHYYIEAQEQAKYDLIQMKEAEFSTLLHQKEQEIKQYQEVISGLQTVMCKETPLETRLASTEIYKKILWCCNHPKEKLKQTDWQDLEKMVDEYLPVFRSTIHTKCHPSHDDYRLCILTRLHFSLSEIGVLTGISPQYLNYKRKHLLKQLFQITGKAEQFDAMVRQINISQN